MQAQSTATIGQDINPSNLITVGLQWDEMQNQEIDLDLQCLLLNELGQIDDAVYFNQLESKISKIKLSEDSHGEKAGYDEFLTIDLNSCPFQVKYVILLICSFKDQPLSYVESSQFHVMQNNQTILETSVGSFGSDGSLSILPCIFVKDYDGTWKLFKIEDVGKGKTFLDNEQLIKKGLLKVGFDEILFEECKNWKGDKSFNLEKTGTLIIPPTLNEIFVGLGWDTNCDIDSSILTFNKHNKLLENIYFGMKTSFNGSIVHHGDNLTGQGSGDDETITIKLDKLSVDVATVWAVITIFNSSYQFDDVNGAYCRLYSGLGEFCKFNLSQNKDGVSTGNIMCCITRCSQNQWTISPKGFYVKGVQTSAQVVQFIDMILNNNFSAVKTIDQILREPQKPVISNTSNNNKQKKQETSSHFDIDIISASGLASFDSNGFSDPYVIFKVNGKKISKTKVINKSLNPVWNFKTKYYLVSQDRIEFKIFDHDSFTTDDYMGSCFYNIEDKDFNQQSTELNLQVQDRYGALSQKYTGTLLVKLTKKENI